MSVLTSTATATTTQITCIWCASTRKMCANCGRRPRSVTLYLSGPVNFTQYWFFCERQQKT